MLKVQGDLSSYLHTARRHLHAAKVYVGKGSGTILLNAAPASCSSASLKTAIHFSSELLCSLARSRKEPGVLSCKGWFLTSVSFRQLSSSCAELDVGRRKLDWLHGSSSKRADTLESSTCELRSEGNPQHLVSRPLKHAAKRPVLISKYYSRAHVHESLGLPSPNTPDTEFSTNKHVSVKDLDPINEKVERDPSVLAPAKSRKAVSNSGMHGDYQQEQDRLRNRRQRECRGASVEETLDRLRRKRKDKVVVLKDKDMSLVPIPGEPHDQYIIRRKRAKLEAQKALKNDMPYGEAGDDWIRRRLGWICRELPVLKAYGLVKMLNGQRSWIKEEHTTELVEHLVKLGEIKRAHRVFKWMRQQPWYRFDYELHNNLSYILGRNDKVSRCQDLFDEIIRNGRVPKASTFDVLIKAYIRKGDDYMDDAWKLYKQMLHLGLKTSSSLTEFLFNGLTCPTGRWLQESEELFDNMKRSGQYINEEMYSKLLEIYGRQGNHAKLDALIQEMKEENLELGLNAMNALLAACSKDGNIEKAERTLRGMTELGITADWRSSMYLIRLFGAAKMPMRAWKIYERMKADEVPINIVTYHALINAMADGLHMEHVLHLLTEVEKSNLKPLQPCFNSAMKMYLRMEQYEEVESIFNRGKAANARPAHAAFNMLIEAYKNTGQFDKADSTFQEMKRKGGAGVNSCTCNLMLEVYGRACLKDKVKDVFQEMSVRGYQVDSNAKVHVQSMVNIKKLDDLEKKKLKLTDNQREVIPGLLLGGADMVASPDNDGTHELHLEFNCENKVARVVKDHISSLFGAWWKRNQQDIESEDEVEDKEKKFTQLETVSHPSLRFYANQYRPEGEPAIPRLIHRWLKPRTLAYWYMYGGRKCRQTGGIVLNASKYPGKQIQSVVKALKARTMDCSRRKKKKGDVIRFEGKSASWLWKLMEPHILDEVMEELRPEVPLNLSVSGEEGNSDDEEGDWEELDFGQAEEVE